MPMEKVKERPILFSAPMVRAILEGRKTQTRRVMKPQPYKPSDSNEYAIKSLVSPFGQPGDRLWVRETWSLCQSEDKCPVEDKVAYMADLKDWKGVYPYGWSGKWSPSIHMPRWASRILLEITDVRVERLQDISNDDVRAEGVECPYPPEVYCEKGYQDHFRELLATIHKPDSLNGWKANPWVWVITFKRLTP